jgi:hypothetical protein
MDAKENQKPVKDIKGTGEPSYQNLKTYAQAVFSQRKESEYVHL